MNDIISRLKNSLYNGGYRDICISLNNKAVNGAFILTSCLIDYLAGLRYSNSKKVTGNDYKQFVREHLSGYDDNDLYDSLRCKLVHNYSEGGKYLLVNNKRNLHLHICTKSMQPYHIGKKIISCTMVLALV